MRDHPHAVPIERIGPTEQLMLFDRNVFVRVFRRWMVMASILPVVVWRAQAAIRARSSTYLATCIPGRSISTVMPSASTR